MSGPSDTLVQAELVDLLYTREGHLGIITLNRPDARNAYSAGMVRSLVEALDRADRDPDCRCIVLTGAGSAFCAGGDLKAMRDKSGMFAGGPAQLRDLYTRGIQTIPRAFARCETPVVAAMNGAAIGAGLDLACMCDIRVAREGAKMGSTFVKVGLVPGDAGAYFLTRTIGFARALEMMLTAKVIEADAALDLGLVHQVVPATELESAARVYAERIAALPPQAVQFTKRAAYTSREASLEQALDLAATFQGVVQNTQDHGEAVAAMLEKREPKFIGR